MGSLSGRRLLVAAVSSGLLVPAGITTVLTALLPVTLVVTVASLLAVPSLLLIPAVLIVGLAVTTLLVCIATLLGCVAPLGTLLVLLGRISTAGLLTASLALLRRLPHGIRVEAASRILP